MLPSQRVLHSSASHMNSTINKRITTLTANTLWLAPLAGVTDPVFRSICKDWGADILVSEMISADGLVYSYDRSAEYAQFSPDQRPFGMQIFGSDPSMMRKGTELLLRLQPDFIDINMGCPVKKVVKRGAGSALMQTPDIAQAIVQAVVPVVHAAGLPVSVKFRSGWDHTSIVAVEFARRMQDAGADILCLHPRTRSMMFGGDSDWSQIAEVKNAVNIPVVGNGDVDSAEAAARMQATTGCDAVMIGRAAWGQPWIFETIKRERTGNPESISPDERYQTVKGHFLAALQCYPQRRAIQEMRTHFAKYSRGLPGGAAIRARINTSTDPDEILQAIKDLFYEQD